ncbi:MAG: hypothetical protein J0M08_01385 [Bacteroidetes bacterium]|nr:hypothetical protein [Bacteroidota bacterium]
MKAKFLVVSAAAAVMALSACKHGPSAETMKAVADFGTNWTTLGSEATTWAADLEKAIADCDAECKNHETMSMEGMSEELKAKAAETANACKSDKSSFEAMKTEWDAFKTSWEENTAAFTAMQEKMNKGEVDEETAKKQLAELTTKMEESKAKVEGWKVAFTAAKESCMKNMEASASIKKMAEEEMAKAPAKKK